ncbi:N-6 DNA methylase [Yinghuangia soli]|uniref:SAM-dependent methyltransferase n=1 Tax=Yinghuangia soli TaxID=2908204 RepID=A0AA41Q4H8_9ACTN|nr:N-6 DNA methylase [Yinghuangia soli]MCF2531176.1 SAM-dependent methyltransferase [Yinghuangia soli]
MRHGIHRLTALVARLPVAGLQTQPDYKEVITVRPGTPGGHRDRYSDPERWARQVTDKVIAAWWRARVGGDIAVPIGTVAALALTRRQPQLDRDGGGLELGLEIQAMSPARFGAWLKLAWGLQWFERPDLVERARILHEWLHLDDRSAERRLRGAHDVALAAIDAGLLELVADTDYRHAVDLFGPLIEQLRAADDKRARGDFYTPASVSRAGVGITFGGAASDLVPGSAFIDPTAGSGGLLRAAAEELRDRGLDPADFAWQANDIDPVAAGACAVNCILWDLGPNSVVACSDVLMRADSIQKARAEANVWLRRRDAELARLQSLAAFRHAKTLLAAVMRPDQDDPTDRAQQPKA